MQAHNMKILRTPDSCFQNLVDYPFQPHYTTITTHDGAALRIHHLDEGPADGPIVLCMHGQPMWSYLYRKMIPYLNKAGMRVIAPDLVGYGRSDKPAAREDYSYERQVEWMGAWLQANDLSGITFFGQDWGGLIGLRLIANHSERFDRVVISNTGLPYYPDLADEVVAQIEHFHAKAPIPTLLQMQKAISVRNNNEPYAVRFAYWQKFCWEHADLPIGFMMSMLIEQRSTVARAVKFLLHSAGLHGLFPTALAKAYDAPFPDPSYKMAPRAMPSHVPTLPTSPSLEQQRLAWEFYDRFEKPFLCAFTDDDPVTAGLQTQFVQRVPGTRGLPHTLIKGGGHFVQERAPRRVSEEIVNLIKITSK